MQTLSLVLGVFGIGFAAWAWRRGSYRDEFGGEIDRVNSSREFRYTVWLCLAVGLMFLVIGVGLVPS